MKRHQIALTAIFLLVFALRVYYSFLSPVLASDDDYFQVRQIEHIKNAGVPLFNDPLRDANYVFSPVYDYFLFLFSFLPIEYIAKIIAQLFASSVVFVVFALIKRLVNSNSAALASAFLAGFVPVYFAETINSLSPLSVSVPLTLFLLYAFLLRDKKSWLYAYIFALVVFSFLNSLVVLIAITLIAYLIILLVSRIPADRAEVELSVFSVFFIMWAQFLLYKKAFLAHGIGVVWQNIPKEVLAEYFSRITVFDIFTGVGVVPFVLGAYAIYKSIFREKNKEFYLLCAFIFSSAVLMWFRLIKPSVGLTLAGISVVMLFGKWFARAKSYLEKTHFAGYANILLALTSLLIAANILFAVDSLAKKAIDDNLSVSDFAVFSWLRNAPEDSVVIALIDEGNLVRQLGGRKSVIDSSFLLVPHAGQLVKDVNRIYSTSFEIEAVDLMQKYRARFIVVSKNAKKSFNPAYLANGNCFKKVYGKDAHVYKRTCKVDEV